MPVVAIVVAALFLALAAAEPAVAASRYTVVSHDTLYSIARRFHVPLPLLEEVNGLHDPSQLRVGQVLIIPDAGPAMYARRPPAGAASVTPPYTASPSHPYAATPHLARDQARGAPRPGPAGAARSASYVARPGDTLYRLALTHGTMVHTIEAMNGLASPAIRAGQVLRLPEPGAPLKTTASRPTPAPGSPLARVGAWHVPVRPASPEPSAVRPAPHSAAPADPRRVRETALGYVGVPYRWGGTTASGVDCSGLVYAVYSAYVANLPRTSYEQWTTGVAVHRVDLEVGDLLFFNTDGSGASHVGIYIGNGRFVHSASSAQRVVIDRLDTPYYLTRYIGARRVL